MAGINSVTPLDSDNVQHKLSFDTRTDAIMRTAPGVDGNGIPFCMGTTFIMVIAQGAVSTSGAKIWDQVIRELTFYGFVRNEASSRGFAVLKTANITFFGFSDWNDLPPSSPAIKALADSRAQKFFVAPVLTAQTSYAFEAAVTISAV